MKKGVFDSVASVSPDGDVTLASGVSLTAHQEIRCLRLCYAITYAGCQGLTLHGELHLDCMGSNNSHVNTFMWGVAVYRPSPTRGGVT